MRSSEYIDKAMSTSSLAGELEHWLFQYGDDSESVRNTRRDMLINIGLGLTGEAGEVADHIKKYHSQGHELDWDKLDKEIGDCLWYIAEYCYVRGTDFENLFDQNIAKLKARYPAGFEIDKSVNREVQ